VARDAHPREDLLRDARALVPRILLRVPFKGKQVEVLAGFRGEALSLYFADDPVFHFNARGELRRAFVADQLIKAAHGRLIAMKPKRELERTFLEAAMITESEQQLLLADLRQRLTSLAAALSSKRFDLLGMQPPDSEALPLLESWLNTFKDPSVAMSPRVG
jgi:hypothetical protein